LLIDEVLLFIIFTEARVFISLDQNIVFWTPWLTFLWQCEEIGTTNLSWCLASADNKSITQPTRESYKYSHSSTRPNAMFAIVFTEHFFSFLFLYYISFLFLY